MATLVNSAKAETLAKPLKLIVEEGGKAQAFELDLDVISIGRTADNAIKISDALSSRHHCQVRRDGEGYVVEDLKSRNGTKLNGSPLKEVVVLKPGDRIEVGETKIHFKGKRKAQSKRAPRPSNRAKAQPGKGPSLMTIQGKARGKQVPLTKLPLVIGRKKGVGLAVADDDVSNEHCMLVEEGGAIFVVDLGSTNGTFISGKRLKGRAPLPDGSQLRLGATLTFAVQGLGGATPAPAPASEPEPEDDDSDEVPADAIEDGDSVVPMEAVEEVDDLDALDDEDEEDQEEDSEPELPPVPDSGRSARPDAAKAEALVAQESEALASIDFGDVEQNEERIASGGGSLGLIFVGLAVLAVLASFGFAASRALSPTTPVELAAEENLVTNWSFEERDQTGGFRGWQLFAAGARQLGKGETRFGRSALALALAPDAPRAEFKSEGIRVKAGTSYRLRASVSLDKNTSAALRIDWSADDKSDYAHSSVAVLTPPASSKRDWEDIEGLVVAPPGANRGTVVGVAVLSAETRGEVRFDRIALQKSEEARKSLVLDAPGGLDLVVRPRGILALERARAELAFDVGPTLDPADRLAGLDAARLDQPLGRQTDESLLALGTLYGPGGKSVEYTFTCRQGSEGLRVRWGTAGESALPLQLNMTLPRLEAVQPLELDGRAVKALPEEGLEYAEVREMAWGRAEKQLSFRFLQPATAVLRPRAGGGATITLAMPAAELANGQREVGFDLSAASQRAKDALRRILREARTARRLRQYAQAIEAYQRLIQTFPHEKADVALAREGLAEVNAQADRLVQVVEWARAEAEAAPRQPLIAAARSAVAELAQGFPGSPQLDKARQALARVEEAVQRDERRAQAERVGRLVSRAQSLRVEGHVRLAREIYTYVIANFPGELNGVAEAKRRLAALPTEESK